ncbi:grifin [Phodopus roborovskii]|uniref:grifin n=1 Tax=Phodopus roborovskii TaxID=109678 RepID=UPI0021E44D1D|nr:grifin [Phodopus roborovskii]
MAVQVGEGHYHAQLEWEGWRHPADHLLATIELEKIYVFSSDPKQRGRGGKEAAAYGALFPVFYLQFEAFCAGGLAPGWSLTVQGHADAGEDKFEINFLTDSGDIAFHVKPRFSSATVVGNAFQGGRWGQEEVSSVFPLTLGEPFEMEVSADAEHFHIYAQEHKILQFPHRHRPLATITRVRVLSDHRLAQVELAKRSLSWGDGGF